MTDITDAKRRLRIEAMAKRDSFEIDDRLEWDQAIAEHALEHTALAAIAGPIAGYWPIRSEADTRPILVGLSERGIATALPVVAREGDGPGRLAFRAWTPWQPIVPGGFGTLIPLDSAGTVMPAALLVPLLAFDAHGYRLGYGKGYYDRAIASLIAQGPLLTIGIAYAGQQVDHVPREAHDQPLDAIMTQDGAVSLMRPDRDF